MPDNHTPETVLVVEDEILIRMPISQYLRDCGYKVIEAASADEAMMVNVRFSNRPVGVKHFQTIRRSSVAVAHGVALQSAPRPFHPPWDTRMRWNNLYRGLAVKRTAGPSGHANSPHPSSREGHHSTARWSSSFLLLDLILSVSCCRQLIRPFNPPYESEKPERMARHLVDL
jgi:hypothetical protein